MDVVKSKARRKTGTAEDWVYEAEIKDTAEDVSTVLHCGPDLGLMRVCRRTSRVLVPYS